MPQVAVIGAGPAGSIAALILARAGIDVILIEQHRFPRDKVCGECLSAMGIGGLGRLGLNDALNHLRPAVLRRAVVFAPNGHSTRMSLLRPMLGISRLKFDDWLLSAACAAGAVVKQPARCEGIDGRAVRIRMLDTNAHEMIDVKYVLVCDGKATLSPNAPSSTGDFGLKAHFRSVDADEDAIELFGVKGHYGGIARIEGGLWNVAFSVPVERIRRFGADLDGLFRQITSENRALAEQMQRGIRVSEWLVSPLPRFGVRKRWERNVIPVGNAAAALEPIGGEGMGLAIRSAELAAGEIVSAIRECRDVNSSLLQRKYCRLWDVRRFACRAGAKIVSVPALARIAVSLAGGQWGGGDNPAAALALRLVGK